MLRRTLLKALGGFIAAALFAVKVKHVFAQSADGMELRRGVEREVSKMTGRSNGATFWGLRVGDTREQAMRQIVALGIQYVYPDVSPKIVVSRPADLPLLSSVEAVLWYPGYAKFLFDGERVIQRSVGPDLPFGASQKLQSASTRTDVFRVFAEIMKRDPSNRFGNLVYFDDPLSTTNADLAARDRFRKYPTWEFSRKADEMFWKVRIEFDRDQIARIDVRASTSEF